MTATEFAKYDVATHFGTVPYESHLGEQRAIGASVVGIMFLGCIAQVKVNGTDSLPEMAKGNNATTAVLE